jgi:hypothetical protein
MLETPNVYLPGSDLPVKIVLPVVLDRGFGADAGGSG